MIVKLSPFLSVKWLWLSYEVGHNHLTVKEGFFSKKVEILLLSRARDITYTQTVFQRLLGVGNIIISSTDDSHSKLILYSIREPELVYEHLNLLIQKNRAGVRIMERT